MLRQLFEDQQVIDCLIRLALRSFPLICTSLYALSSSVFLASSSAAAFASSSDFFCNLSVSCSNLQNPSDNYPNTGLVSLASTLETIPIAYIISIDKNLFINNLLFVKYAYT